MLSSLVSAAIPCVGAIFYLATSIARFDERLKASEAGLWKHEEGDEKQFGELKAMLLRVEEKLDRYLQSR